MKLTAVINLHKLRTDAPGWEWSAERFGMGWRYIGFDDDCETVWLVDDGKTSTNYYSWLMINSGKSRGLEE